MKTDPSSPRVLALLPVALGDLLVSLPALLAIGGRRLEIWGRLDFLPVLRGHPGVDAIAPFERPGIHRLFSERAPDPPVEMARAIAPFDLVVAGLGSPGGALEKNLRAAGARRVVTAPVPPRDARGGPRAALRVRAALEAAGLALAPHERLSLRAESAAAREPLFLFHPGSGSPKKNWPLERFFAVAARARVSHGLEPLAVTGPADAPLRDALRSSAIPVRDTPPIEDLLALLARARLYLGNDSGVTHLAAAAGARGAAIFGPTDPAVWGPDSDAIRVLRAGDDPADVSEADVLAALER